MISAASHRKAVPAFTNRRRGPSLEILIYKMGGVAGCARRIIYRRDGLFTINDIRAALSAQYPRLIPGQDQIEGVIEDLEKRGHIKCVSSDKLQKTFKRMPRQPAATRNITFSKAEIPKGKRQLKFIFE